MGSLSLLPGKVGSNPPKAINDQDACGINPCPIQWRNPIFSNHVGSKRVKPCNSSRHKITNQVCEVGQRTPNRQPPRKARSGEKRTQHHCDSQPHQKGETVRPTRVSGRQRKMRVQQIGSSSQKSNNKNLPVGKNILPFVTTIHPLNHTGQNDRKQGMCNRIHWVLSFLNRKLSP